MTTTRTFWRLAKLPLAVSLASALAAPAYAVNFNIGEIEGQVDSSLSLGASWSMRWRRRCRSRPSVSLNRRFKALRSVPGLTGSIGSIQTTDFQGHGGPRSLAAAHRETAMKAKKRKAAKATPGIALSNPFERLLRGHASMLRSLLG